MTQASFSADPAQTPEAQPQGTSFTPASVDDTPPTPPEGVTPQLSAEDVAALVKRDVHAQSHIVTLETETTDLKTQMVEMQSKLDLAATAQEVLEAQGQSTVNVDDIVTKATQALTAQQAATTAEQLATSNFQDVSNTLSEKYGTDKVDEAVKKACSENGMSWDEMVTLAKSNPLAAKRLCNVEVKPQAQPMQTSINSSAVLGSYQQQQQETPKVNVMELRTDSDRVADYTRRMELKLKELNL